MINLAKAVNEFSDRLSTLDVNNLEIENYPKEYLIHLILHRQYYLSIYRMVIEKSMEADNHRIEDIQFVDYGSGNGLLGIFASYVGFGKVFCVDTDIHFLQAAKLTASLLGFPSISFISGGESGLKNYPFEGAPVIVAGTDVIEHIYDLGKFFSILKSINGIVSIVFTTASNPANPFILKKLKQLHLKDEYYGGSSTDRSLFGDDHISFSEMRSQIIKSVRSDLSDEIVKRLTKSSRGLNKEDVLVMLEQFSVDSNYYFQEIDHPTNTCDPLTGSWSERIIELDEFALLYKQNDFSIKISCGFFNQYKGGVLRRRLTVIINKFISISPLLGIKFAPFIVISGKKE